MLAVVGAFAAFSLMTIAIGTDYWLYSRAYICNATNVTTDESQMQTKKVRGDLTHSGLWRICCIEGKIKSNKLVSVSLRTFLFCFIPQGLVLSSVVPADLIVIVIMMMR